MIGTDALLARVASYYEGKLTAHGTTPAGVDWNSEASQQLRFRQLLRIVQADDAAGSINDYGCGYGSLAGYLRAHHPTWTYCGYDVSAMMIDAARSAHRGEPDRAFTTDRAQLAKSTYTVASGIFNVKLEFAEDDWTSHVLATLDALAAVSDAGFAFNVLTGYADHARRRPDLYYADPHALFEHCRRRFSPQVALLHDYPLYEFTMLVRL